MAVDFGKFSRSKAEAQKLQQAATQVKDSQSSTSAGALPSRIQSTTADSVFGTSSGADAKVDAEKFIQNISGVEDLNDLSELQKAQYDLLVAFADVDGNGISKDEFNNLAALDGEDTAHFTKEDIDAIYEELGLASDASVDELMEAIDKVFEEEEAQKAAEISADKVDAKTVPAEHSGAKINADGQYELTVETYRDGKVQDDGNGGTRYPNGSMWGMVTNAYPDLPENQKEQVYEQIAELNGWDEGWQNHVLHTGDNVKMPVLEYDENGNVTGFKDKIEVEKEDDDIGVPKAVGGGQWGVNYEVKNEDGSVTTYTKSHQGVIGNKTTTYFDDNGNKKSSSTTDTNGNVIETREYEADGSYTATYKNGITHNKPDVKEQVYEFDANGNATKITTKNNDGSYSVRTFDSDGKPVDKNYDKNGTLIEAEEPVDDIEAEQNYQRRLDDINSTASLTERAGVLNTTLSGDYGLSAQEKAEIINEALAEFNGNPGDAQYYVKGDNANNLRTNINNVIQELSDEEFMEFAQKFETSFGKSLTTFMDESGDNSTNNKNYVGRLTDLYSNAGPDLSKVLEQFPIRDSVQYLLKGDIETTAVQDILTGVLDDVPESDNAKIDSLASKVENDLGYLNEILDSNNYTDQEKAQILKQIGAETVTKYIRNKWSNSDQEAYLTKIMGYLAGAVEA